MKVTVHEELQCCVIKPQGRFGEEDCHVLKEVLEQSANSPSRHVLVDLNDLSNITASGQRVLLSFSAQLQALHRSLVFYNINQPVMDAFESSGLSKVIFIAPNHQAAKALALAGK